MTEADNKDIEIEELEKDGEENLESRAPMLQNVKIRIMKEKIQREVGIIENVEISDGKHLHKIQNNRENKLKIEISVWLGSIIVIPSIMYLMTG